MASKENLTKLALIAGIGFIALKVRTPQVAPAPPGGPGGGSPTGNGQMGNVQLSVQVVR